MKKKWTICIIGCLGLAVAGISILVIKTNLNTPESVNTVDERMDEEHFVELPAIGDTISTESGTWELVWSDEFAGNDLDLTKWDYQTGNGILYGVSDWGNKEEEFYTEENVSVSDGTLKIEAKKEEKGGKSYTSGRIRTLADPLDNGLGTETLFSKCYGKFEARIKLPAGSGLWPAFWLLPDPNGNSYGTWAASGEIDIMEAKGRLTGETSGTLHYGQQWPDNKYSGGTNYFSTEQSTEEYHVYSIEWEPDEIRWYVDGELFHTENSWYSRGESETEDYPFPAPFDEEFYILLNLAVGGNFDNGIVPEEEVLPAVMEVDYVRVYDLEGGYDETVASPKIVTDEEGAALYINVDTDYNYVQDSIFDTVNKDMLKIRDLDVNSSNWYFLALTEYSGSAVLENGEDEGYEYVSVNVLNKGNQTYSVQLIQHLPLIQGYKYELSFDAKAKEERTILSKLGGDDDNGWLTYAGQFEDQITTQWQHYTQKFQMFSETDGTARLEFNLGGETGEVQIANVSLKIIP